MLSIEKFAGYKTEVKERPEIGEMLALRNKVKEAEHSEFYGGLRDEMGMKTYLHGPMDYVKTLKLRLRVGDLDLPEKRGMPIADRRRTKMHRCALVPTQ